MDILSWIKENAEIIAIVLAPLVTWGITIMYQNRSEKRKAKQDLFLTLMANRKKFPPPYEYLDALNSIDVVFQNNKKVRAAWRAYHDSLHPNSQHSQNTNSFLLDLLTEIAQVLGYKNLKQTEIDRFYSPQYYGNMLENQARISQELSRVLFFSKNFAEGYTDEEIQERINPSNK